MIKPKLLKKGDTIAIVSPSSGAPYLFPHIFNHGLKILSETFGFKIKEYPTARMSQAELYANPKKRAVDINNAFADNTVQGIICSIGGNDSIRILKDLNLSVIKSNHKFFMGFSDSTTFLSYLNLHGLVTYYGSSVMAGFSQMENFKDSIYEYKQILFTGTPYAIKPFSTWADSYKNWIEADSVGKVSDIKSSELGHRWINKGRLTHGSLWGGCLEVLEMMNGTFAWPHKEFWHNKVLMIETSPGKPTPEQVSYAIRNFGIQGILNQLSGLIIGRPKGYTEEEKLELDQAILRVAIEEFNCTDLNIISNIDFGHTDPRHILPMGIQLEINPDIEQIKFTENLFS